MDRPPPSKPRKPRDASAARQARIEREAAALRENLRKRKEQARALALRADGDHPVESGEDEQA
jgi:hypothetical protein